MKTEYEIKIAHVNTTTGDIQTCGEHTRGVSMLAGQFAAEFGYEAFGRVLGTFHDKGKEKFDFQTYIRLSCGLPALSTHYSDKSHAYVGAILAHSLYQGENGLLTFPIAGHHSGLDNYSDLERKLSAKVPDGIDCPASEILERLRLHRADLHHLVRMLFSCLVDADFLDTEAFMNPDTGSMRKNTASLASLADKLEHYLQKLNTTTADTPVNRIRKEVQQACRKASVRERGFYSLTVPTGGGKTLSSLLWAILHAMHNGMRRIIIAIPYTSIIVQTATILKEIFGDENVLEHHCNTVDEAGGNSATRLKKKLAAENWDCPIIVTTNVQLFESVFASKVSKCRKLHNIANSVIILDEIQTLPVQHLQPIVDSLNAYRRLFGTSVLFTTASMPALTGNHRGNGGKEFRGFGDIKEIVPPGSRLYDRLRRVDIEFDYSPSSYDDISSRLTDYSRVLCIVNTRRDAGELYSRLPDEGRKYHLSRMMCPAHIRRTIDEIKEALRNPSSEVIRVVATQLIEAGVDIDFPVVYRQEAGLDSILQAAGRCNREGRLERGHTTVFSLAGEHALPCGTISQAAAACRNTGFDDPFAPEAMTDYFRHYYSRSHTFDAGPGGETAFIEDALGRPAELRFRDAAEGFRLISDKGKTLYVNWGEGASLISGLKANGPSRNLMRRLGLYSVNVTQRDFDTLRQYGAVEEVIDGIYWVPSPAQYSDRTGLTLDNTWLEEILII